MADIKFLSGITSNIFVSTIGSSNRAFMFRVDNRPVKFPFEFNLSEGDEVKVAGFIKMGELHAVVVKNMTTGVSYSTKNKGVGTMFIWVGVLFCLFIITIPMGILMIIIGIVYGKEFDRNEKLLERF